VISTEPSAVLIHTVPSCTVTCSCMLRSASFASAWLSAASICQTTRLAARVSLVSMFFHQTGVLLAKL
jgi:hypothetical protein